MKLPQEAADQRVVSASHERVGPRASQRKLSGPIGTPQHLHELRLATERLGGAEQTMRWILGFADRDLNRLRREERTALVWDFRALIGLYALGWHTSWAGSTPIPNVDLSQLQIEVAKGVRALLQKDTRLTMWPQSTNQTTRLSSKWEPESKTHRYRLLWGGTNRDAIIAAIWNVILEVGDKLRSCTECGTPFVAVKRQEY